MKKNIFDRFNLKNILSVAFSVFLLAFSYACVIPGNAKGSVSDTAYSQSGKHYTYYRPYRNIMKTVTGHAGKPDGTYDIHTGETISYKKGYAFSFHQNEPDENGNFKSVYGRYTEAEYDRIANELAEKYDLPINIGVYDGSPEVSFYSTDLNIAMSVAEKYNQQSIYDCNEDKLIENPHYNPKLNPMKP